MCTAFQYTNRRMQFGRQLLSNSSQCMCTGSFKYFKLEYTSCFIPPVTPLRLLDTLLKAHLDARTTLKCWSLHLNHLTQFNIKLYRTRRQNAKKEKHPTLSVDPRQGTKTTYCIVLCWGLVNILHCLLLSESVFECKRSISFLSSSALEQKNIYIFLNCAAVEL